MRLSLSFKIIGIVLIISLIFFPPLAYFHVENSKRILEEVYIEKAETIAQAMDAGIRNLSELRDESRLFASIQKNIWLEPDIESIDINLPSQRGLTTYVSSRVQRNGTLADEDNLRSYQDDRLVSHILEKEGQRFLEVVTPIHIAKQRAGTYQIVLSLEKIDRQINGTIKLLIFSYCLMLLLFVLLLFWSLKWIMVNPIQKMNEGVQTIATGKLNHRIDLHSNDEIGSLATAINRMTTDLQQTTMSKNEVEEIFQTMLNALFVVNLDAKITTVNRQTLKLLGYEEREVTGKIMDLVLEERRNKNVRNDVGVDHLLEKKVINLVNRNCIKKGGEKIPVLFSASVMSNPEGKIQGVVCVAQDITELKQAEENLKQVNENLRAANRELKETQAQLIQTAKLASIGELATGIAHELNQPLMYIRNNAQLLTMDGADHLDPQEAHKTLLKIEKGSDRMMIIINHLKSFSRQLEREQAPVVIHEIIENSLVLLNEQFRIHNIQLKKKYASEVPQMMGNANQLEQVFINLLTNARDALEEKENAVITIQTEVYQQENASKQVAVRVSDNGCGISPLYLEKIFDPFFSTKEEGKGTGLGLSISYGIIQDHHGKINVFSNQDRGTTFEILFPSLAE